MTKTISLADDAYAALLDVKAPGESFSSLARRLAKRAAMDRFLDPSFGVDMDAAGAQAAVKRIHRARDQSLEPRS